MRLTTKESKPVKGKCSRCFSREEIAFGVGRQALCAACFEKKWEAWHQPRHLRDPHAKNPPDLPGQTTLGDVDGSKKD